MMKGEQLEVLIQQRAWKKEELNPGKSGCKLHFLWMMLGADFILCSTRIHWVPTMIGTKDIMMNKTRDSPYSLGICIMVGKKYIQYIKNIQ